MKSTFFNRTQVLTIATLTLSCSLAYSQPFTGGVLVAQVDGSDCALCVQLAQSALRKLPGVTDVWVAPANHRIALELDNTHVVESEAVILLMNRSGYAVRSLKPSATPLRILRAGKD